MLKARTVVPEGEGNIAKTIACSNRCDDPIDRWRGLSSEIIKCSSSSPRAKTASSFDYGGCDDGNQS